MSFSKIKFDERILSDNLSLDATFIASVSKERIVIKDAASGLRMVYEGEGFKVVDGEVVKGTIEDFSMLTRNGKPVVEISKAFVDVAPLGGGDIMTFFESFASAVLLQPNKFTGSELGDSLFSDAGIDIVRSLGGNDFLDGGTGNDVLVGGAGSDTFMFNPGMGSDTIRDFDADGGVGRQDTISANFNEIAEIAKIGRDTVIRFDGGDRFVLQDVKLSTIDETDFSGSL